MVVCGEEAYGGSGVKQLSFVLAWLVALFV